MVRRQSLVAELPLLGRQVMEFFEWIKLGYEKGFCSDVACSTHDPLYTHEEMEGFEQGDDPCLHMVRIFSPGYVAYEPLEKS